MNGAVRNESRQNPSDEWAVDVVVVGAALVGASCALGLAQQGLSVAVIEARPLSHRPAPEPFDLRVYALSLGSARFLDTLGIWGQMDAKRLSPFRRMHVWDSGGPGAIHFDALALHANALGYLTEDWMAQRALDTALDDHANITVLRPTTVTRIDVSAQAVRVHTDARTVVARLVIGADGSQSQVRDIAQIDAVHGTYGQRGVVGLVKTVKHHEETAWQRFLPGGPLAFLPMPDGLSSVVWSAPDDQADALVAMNDDDFGAALAHALDFRLGAVEPVSARAAFPLGWATVSRYVATRIALIGDAAHTIHPLAGQGVNLGLMDAATLVETAGKAHREGRDVGMPYTLRRYERWRKAHNVYVQESMSRLLWLFGRREATWRGARSVGLSAVNRLTPLKTVLSGLAMGLSGDIPAAYRTPRERLDGTAESFVAKEG